MKSLKNKLTAIWKDESAQGATEYILLLVVVVTIALIFRRQISDIVRNKIGQVGGAIDGFNVEGQ